MKKRIRNIIAVLVALSSLPVTGMTAAALDMPWCWGETTWDAFEGEEPINDHGMLTGEYGTLYDGNGYDVAILVSPRRNVLRIVLRDDADLTTVPMQMAELLEDYFPGIRDGWNEESYQNAEQWVFALPDGIGRFEQVYQRDEPSRVFELWFYNESMPDDPEQLETDILLAFARNHLISGFYGFGSTANYLECWTGNDVLANYSELDISDWDSVQTYLTERDPSYTLERYKAFTFGDGETIYFYRVNGLDALSFREKIELAGELYEQFGLSVTYFFPASVPETTLGHNALENPGDVTLDTEIDIMDVIALNKQLLGAETLCDTAKKNADVGGDGTPDETDSLAILKEVVGLTTNLAET